jgi:hypothetical protein
MTNRVVPNVSPMVKKIDSLITESIPNLRYAIKWGKAYYGSQELGWIIEVSAYEVSVNIVFLSGAKFDHQPPLGDGDQSRYVKLKTLDEVNQPEIQKWIQQAGLLYGWKRRKI